MGGHSPLLHIGHPRKRNGARYTFLSKGEERNLLPKEVRLEISGGGQLCAFHQYLYVILNLFQDLATVEFHGYSKRLPQRRNIGQTLNQVQGDMKMLDCTPAKPVEPSNCARPTCLSTSSRNEKDRIWWAAPPCGISNENCCGMTT